MRQLPAKATRGFSMLLLSAVGISGLQAGEDVKKRVEEIALKVEATKAIIGRVRNLAKFGFQVCDNKTHSVQNEAT